MLKQDVSMKLISSQSDGDKKESTELISRAVYEKTRNGYKLTYDESEATGFKGSTTTMDECDVVVPRRKIADFIKYTHQVARELSLRIPSFGHAGDGNLHVYICRDGLEQSLWEEKLAAAFEKMYKKAGELGGQVSGEHGIGFAKRPYLRERLGEVQIGLMRRIKEAFDPKGLLNPDKIFTLSDED